MPAPCVFGEVLFDQFPDGSRVLGGAPFNVAWHLQAFGQAPGFISRVGNDPEGKAIRDAMTAWGMNTEMLQLDPVLPTGRVTVSLNHGEPSYEIVRPCAYDAIDADTVRARCSILYHGTLALREPASRLALEQLKHSAPSLVFIDVNLRSPWWQRENVEQWLRGAHWAKLNGDELALLRAGIQPEIKSIQRFMDDYELEGLILTHGAAGAEIVTADGAHARVSPARETKIVDTVGAGDAFASVIILGLLQEWPFATILQRAQAFASQVVGRRGATIEDPGFYRHFLDAWNNSSNPII